MRFQLKHIPGLRDDYASRAREGAKMVHANATKPFAERVPLNRKLKGDEATVSGNGAPMWVVPVQTTAFAAATPAAPFWSPYTYDLVATDGSGLKWKDVPNVFPHYEGWYYNPAFKGTQDAVTYDNGNKGFFFFDRLNGTACVFIVELASGKMFPVLVTKDAGSAGTYAADCSFTYTVTDIAGNSLGTGMTPIKPRITGTPYSQPADGSYGMGFYDDAGDFQLYEAVEEKPTGPTVAVVIDEQVSGVTLQKKLQYVRVLAVKATDEGFSTWHTGTSCPS